jgi:hypothetical protein
MRQFPGVASDYLPLSWLLSIVFHLVFVPEQRDLRPSEAEKTIMVSVAIADFQRGCIR